MTNSFWHFSIHKRPRRPLLGFCHALFYTRYYCIISIVFVRLLVRSSLKQNKTHYYTKPGFRPGGRSIRSFVCSLRHLIFGTTITERSDLADFLVALWTKMIRLFRRRYDQRNPKQWPETYDENDDRTPSLRRRMRIYTSRNLFAAVGTRFEYHGMPSEYSDFRVTVAVVVVVIVAGLVVVRL